MGLSVYATNPYRHGDMKVLDLRGWGHLTGIGACRLEEDDAIAIQKANGALAAAAPDYHKHAHHLAMLVLQSALYATDPDVRDQVDNVLAIHAKAEGR